MGSLYLFSNFYYNNNFIWILNHHYKSEESYEILVERIQIIQYNAIGHSLASWCEWTERSSRHVQLAQDSWGPFLWWMSDTVSELSLVRESGESLGSIELECQNWRRSLNLQIHHILGPHHGNSLLAASSSTASFKWVKDNMGTNDGNCDPYIGLKGGGW